MYCVLDIESTGGPYGKESIMEIALFKYDGNEIVDQLISLVHPHREVQKYVSKITGITSKMLIRAPRFHELAKRILELTEGSVLVGHNAEFDYRMLRQEFARLGYPFEMQTLDTIPFTEKLIPGLQSYGLDRVCEELGIFRGQKHRAGGDARATLDLLILLLEKDQEKDISILNQSIQNNDPIKDKINDLKRSVKFNKGIYYLHDKAGKLLYLDNSDNIKNALNKLFIADNDVSKKLAQEVYSVNAELTGNWLVASLKKKEEARKAQPKYNKIRSTKYGFKVQKNLKSKTKIFNVVARDFENDVPVIFYATSLKAAYRSFRMMNRSYTETERTEVIQLLEDFPDRATFTAAGRNPKERCAFIIENGKLVGYQFFRLNDEIGHFDRLQKSMVPIDVEEDYTNLLKMGVLSGEFRLTHIFELEA